MQSEYYTTKSLDAENPNKLAVDFEAGVNENPTHVVFNGCVGKHTDAGGTPLTLMCFFFFFFFQLHFCSLGY